MIPGPMTSDPSWFNVLITLRTATACPPVVCRAPAPGPGHSTPSSHRFRCTGRPQTLIIDECPHFYAELSCLIATLTRRDLFLFLHRCEPAFVPLEKIFFGTDYPGFLYDPVKLRDKLTTVNEEAAAVSLPPSRSTNCRTSWAATSPPSWASLTPSPPPNPRRTH
jgi:hypothetical protein